MKNNMEVQTMRKGPCLAMLFLGLLLAIGVLVGEAWKEKNLEHTTVLEQGWYRMVNGEAVAVEVPGNYYTSNETLTLYYGGDLTGFENHNIAFYGADYQVEIYFDDECLYSVGDDLVENRLMMSNRICTTQLPRDVEGGTLSMVLHNPKGTGYTVRSVKVGETDALWRSLLVQDFSLLAALVSIVTGLLCLLVVCVIENRDGIQRRLFYICLYLLLCGIWSLTDSQVILLFTDYSNVALYLNHYSFMLLLVPIFYYLSELFEKKRSQPLTIGVVLCMANVIGQSVAALLGIATLHEMLPISLALTVVLLASLTVIVLRIDRSTLSEDVRLSLTMLPVVGVLAIAAILLYIIGASFYQITFQIGVLCFTAATLYGLGKELWNQMKYRAQAEYYRRVAEEDKLTHLKNQRAYDELIEELRSNRKRYPEAHMVFADLNGLKAANDRYGHAAGNELIQAAANCLRAAFEQHGECFRIGGDEFCVVVLNPVDHCETLIARFEEEIARYNAKRGAENQLSIAYGVSMLSEHSSVEEWIAAADRRMYRDKRDKHGTREEI